MKSIEMSNTITVLDGKDKCKREVSCSIPCAEKVDDLKTLCNGEERRMVAVINAGLKQEYRSLVRGTVEKNYQLDDEQLGLKVQQTVDNHVAGRVVLTAVERKLQGVRNSMTDAEYEEFKNAVIKS